MLLYWIIKSLSIPSADKYSKKHLKVCEADTLKQVDANVREEENKNRSSLYYSDKLEAQLRKASKEKELAKTKKEKREKEAQERKARLDSLLDSNNYCLDSSLDINPKNNLEDEKATTAKDLLTTVYSANKQTRMRDSLSARKNEVVAIDSANSILCDLSDLLVVRFCIFSNSALENISILTNKEVVEMQTNTTTALANKLAAINKLVRLQTFTLKILEHVETIILEANTPAMHSKATKHYLAPLAAQFVIVCSFRKVDKHVFRAYNTISVTAQQTIIRKGGPYIEKRFNATNKRDSVTSDRIYKIEDARNIITNIKHDASKHESSYKDILEKEGLNKLEASRRVIFNCFKMQAIASYSALATLKAAQFKIYSSCKVKRFTLNSVKDLFTNLSKNYFLSIAAEDTAKAANILPPLKEVCAKILIELYKLIVQAIIVALIAFAEAIILTEATHVVIIELQDSIVYFNLDSKLELKVLGKQDVKTTS
ncbi:hypothetical protein HBH92_242520 [Parastagonospora nodorum]|nr:hypothetical protein HBH93_246210 [Parastagonospora nodorum]KAH4399950.1 hypothetical protein HBH92_242520 [Parastagonospora nodorum]KAH4522805.1 hypothetical protein HBH85_244850 [Parastagonospora nodorum]KAH4522953.1 hypothetical protein HBH86_244620 [Parastagonospora nodorum]KAH4842124.1 hypothetical protein HBH58_240970 [Parastagonospora nodorum]